METPPPLDTPLLAASAIILGILLSSLVLWYQRLKRRRDSILPRTCLDSWSIGWVNFGLFICGLILWVTLFQTAGGLIQAQLTDNESKVLTPWLAVYAVLLLQVPLLVAYYLSQRCFSQYFACQINFKPFTLLQAVSSTLPVFIRFLPLIWLASLLWTHILEDLQGFGLIDKAPPQELVQLFQSGGDPLAIGLLVIFAIVLAPIVEEIIFRACIYRFLKGQMSLLLAQLLSATLFALVHANLLSFAPLLLVGILLARNYERSGNLLIPILFHAFFNAFSLTMLLLISQSDWPMP
jgi:membrane protease YdiL (CAAX protease family)